MGISDCLGDTEMTGPHCGSNYVLALRRDEASHINSFGARLLKSRDIPRVSSCSGRARLRRTEHK